MTRWIMLTVARATFMALPSGVARRLWRSRWYALALEHASYQNRADFFGAPHEE